MVTSAICSRRLVGLAIGFRNLRMFRVLLASFFPQKQLTFTTTRASACQYHSEANRSHTSKQTPHLKRAVLAIEDSHFLSTPQYCPYGAALRAFFVSSEVRLKGRLYSHDAVGEERLLSAERKYSRKGGRGQY